MPLKKVPKKGIQVRVDADVSARAERVFRAVGLDTPTAIRMFFAKVAVTGGIPFPVRDDTYDVYSPEELAEIDAAYRESFDERNLRGPFKSVDEMFEDIEQQKP